MRCKVQVRFGAERPGNSSTTPGLSLHCWAMDNHLPTELVVAALEMAFRQRHPDQVIHHSNHGSQYTSITFDSRCTAMGVKPSMGSVGDCFDNAMAESFFATLECELLDKHNFKTRAEAKMGHLPLAGKLVQPEKATLRSGPRFTC
jgi:transposase InsO family protein